MLAVDLGEPFVVTVLLRRTLCTAGASAASPEPARGLWASGSKYEEREEEEAEEEET